MSTETKPAAGSRRYTIETFRAGQSRPYGNTIHEFVLTIEWMPYGKDKDWELVSMPDDIVKEKGRALGTTFVDNGEWFQPKLKSMTKISEGKWRFIVETEYTD